MSEESKKRLEELLEMIPKLFETLTHPVFTAIDEDATEGQTLSHYVDSGRANPTIFRYKDGVVSSFRQLEVVGDYADMVDFVKDVLDGGKVIYKDDIPYTYSRSKVFVLGSNVFTGVEFITVDKGNKTVRRYELTPSGIKDKTYTMEEYQCFVS